ncbi:glutathione S-transferase family protein [Rhizobium skierniewicense]|uniref:glutathione S-transferase family protein n=1 Tax=Rhizobium skierniewicense TaxID=984260 RepID=UPI001573F20F|nr:glutathione S-transferase family protein [Rhizobium skierniewicense]NTF32017.1 glutathione S-transferase family protein [Rhizobium skierniewicense]
MSELIFYTNPMSRGRIVRWMLEETGAPYKTEYLGYGSAMKSDAYTRINPMGKVPAIRHGDTVVTESAAICAYLADAFPEAGLAPPTTDRGNYYRWFFFAAGPLEMSSTTRALGFDITPDKERMAGCGAHRDVLDALEHGLKANRFIAGDQFTAADVYVGSQIIWGIQFGSLERRGRFMEYLKDLHERPAYQRATKIDTDAANAHRTAM